MGGCGNPLNGDGSLTSCVLYYKSRKDKPLYNNYLKDKIMIVSSTLAFAAILSPLSLSSGDIQAQTPEINRNINRIEQREINHKPKDFSPLFALQVQGKSALFAKVGCQCSQCVASQVV